jgi:hypothetical protein
VSDRISSWLGKPETLATVQKLGDAIAGLFTDQNLDTVAKGMETAANAVGMAIGAFNKLPPEIKALAIGAFAVNKVTGGAVTGAAEAVGKILGAGLKQIFAANVTVIGTNVVSPGGGVNVPGALTGVAGAAGGASIAATVGATLAVLGLSTAAMYALLHGVPALLTPNRKPESGVNTRSANSPGYQAQRQIVAMMPPSLQASMDAIKNNTANMPTFVNNTPSRLEAIRAAAAKTAGDTVSEGNATQRAIAAQQQAQQTGEAASLRAFRAGERATNNVGTKINTSNSKLGTIARKKTSFSTTVKVNTSMSVSDVTGAVKYRSRISRGNVMGVS